MRRIKLASLLTASVLLSACAGRDAVPVQTVQPTDEQLSCEQISAEQQQISSKVNALIKEDEEAHGRNIAIGVVGAIIFWPALFALDTGEAEQTEIAALRSRSDYLNSLAGRKNCGLMIPTSVEGNATVEIKNATDDKVALQRNLEVFIQENQESVANSLQQHLRNRGLLLEDGDKVNKLQDAKAIHLDGKSFNLMITYFSTSAAVETGGQENGKTATFQVLFDGQSLSFI